MILRSPLDAWLAGKLGCSAAGFDPEILWQYQRRQLQEVLQWVRSRSPFYRKRLQGLPIDAVDFTAGWNQLPFTTADDLRQYGAEFLCVSQSEIQRMVTLETSGTSGAPKRLGFSAEEQTATMEFFAAGMATLVDKTDRVLILLPGRSNGSVGDLLARALMMNGIVAIPHGLVDDPAATLGIMRQQAVTCLVGSPIQVLALARWPDASGAPPALNSVLLSTDYAARSLVGSVAKKWHCRVFDHYGMTEMGLGGGIDCQAHSGYHLRENDLYFEVIDPASGLPAAAGQSGEVVFTTLTRRSMPLIRYRSGDRSRFLTDSCPCGSPLRRLAYLEGRSEERFRTMAPLIPSIAELDETIFAIPNVVDYTAAVQSGSTACHITLKLLTVAGPDHAAASAKSALSALLSKTAADYPAVSLEVQAAACGNRLPRPTGKRKIHWMEENCDQ